jgi:hypothetical protein
MIRLKELEKFDRETNEVLSRETTESLLAWYAEQDTLDFEAIHDSLDSKTTQPLLKLIDEPWFLETAGGICDVLCKRPEGHFYIIANVRGYGSKLDQIAHGKLMAAAPLLYAICKECVSDEAPQEAKHFLQALERTLNKARYED